MYKILIEFGITRKLVRLINLILTETYSRVRVGENVSDRFPKLKECSASSSDYKCINCVNFNKYSGNTKVCENHSSLDKSCPSLQAVIMKYKLNTDY